MRPFFGYNAGHYMQHWLDLEKNPNHKMPKIFHVNWFRRDASGGFLWPGFGENSRVLKWICERIDDQPVAQESAIGLVPTPGSLDIEGLGDLNMDELMSVPKDYWLEELDSLKQYYDEQLGEDLPQDLRYQYDQLKARIEDL
jgi:phosphoenolpyruvate carboxykinase (GTP)